MHHARGTTAIFLSVFPVERGEELRHLRKSGARLRRRARFLFRRAVFDALYSTRRIRRAVIDALLSTRRPIIHAL
jgi:hypothetical protein